MDHSPGQPKKLTEEQRRQLASMLEQQQPADVGFEARYTWTLPLVTEWIQREFGVTMSVRGISAMLKRMNFSFTKATYTLANADEEAQAFFKSTHSHSSRSRWRLKRSIICCLKTNP